MRSRKIVVLLVCLSSPMLVPRLAAGYSITNHVLITEAAARFIRGCADANPGRWDHLQAIDAHLGTLAACNMKQDDVERKIKLWHFYGGARRLKGRWTQGGFLSVADQFDDYYRMITQGLLEAQSEPERVYAHLGAILHYIQDVAVPAHAIPIFHPSPLWNGDNFDSYPFQATTIPTDTASCERLLSAEADTLATLLAETAERTLAAVAEEIPPAALTLEVPGAVVPRTWRLFWDTTLDGAGFGDYGCVRDSFGLAALSCGGTRLSVSPEAATTFALGLHRSAVEATVRAIAVAGRLTALPPTPGTAITCPVAGKSASGELVVCVEALSGPATPACPGESEDMPEPKDCSVHPDTRSAPFSVELAGAILLGAGALFALRRRRRSRGSPHPG